MVRQSLGSFPHTRMRRLRVGKWMRDMVAEYQLTASDLILPLFVCEGENVVHPVKSLRNVSRLSIDKLIEKVEEAQRYGVCAVAIFPVVENALKDEEGKEAINPDNLACRAVRALKNAVPDVGVICDVALDPYMSHGHDGIMVDGLIDNDVSLAVLGKQALVLAEAGCDVVAPSDMMDGRVGYIRGLLEDAGKVNMAIMSYSAKYASSFYGPFRDAVGSSVNLGKADKKSYQMDFRNSREAISEVALDISEGADMIMIKPGMPYLDILRDVSRQFSAPIFAYQVSGEYAMLCNAIDDGILSEEAHIESLLAFKRAGASGIFTYGAIEIAKKIHKED